MTLYSKSLVNMQVIGQRSKSRGFLCVLWYFCPYMIPVGSAINKRFTR